ncbi:HET domain protein [Aspergillus ambiguus]|uniref:HET domain-containing protein n=1 Tax=Aspergillus ambiguus TaxID=176160 RepID=UPI003CCDC5F2
MDHPSGSFSYSALNPAAAEIRLVTIAPEKNENSPVRCTLQTVSLDNPPRFEALSYVWGSVGEKVEILVDDISFQVTTNLRNALRCLRHSRKKRIIWIDYICIDQNNVKEKNTQLPLMGRIYREATSVVSWLGPLTPNMEQAMLMIKRRESSLAGMLWDVRQKRPWGQKTRRDMIGSVLDAIQGFLEIVSASYWGRIWTFQEYYLPEKLPVCMVGNLPFTLPSLVELGKHFTEILSPFMEDLDKIAPQSSDADDIDDHHKLRSRLKEAQERLAQSNPMTDFAHDIAAQRKGLSSFADVLDLTVSRQCFNPLDRFYGLYALVDGVQKKYPVDYDSGADEVALQITIWILIYEGVDFVFNMFHFYEGRHGNILGGPSPSWVPNYRDSTSRTNFRFKSIDNSLQVWEQGDRMTNISILPFKYVLHFWARPVGRTRIIFKFPEDALEIVKRILHTINEPDTTWGNGVDHENMAERLIWTFFAHTQLQQTFSVHDIRRSLEELADSTSPSEPCGKQLLRALPSLAGRTVFQLTDCPTGGFGVGVGTVHDGDLLILSGKMMNPVALRDSGFRNTDEDVVYYNMIGNAFVEGIAEDQKEAPTPLLSAIRGQQFEKFLII